MWIQCSAGTAGTHKTALKYTLQFTHHRKIAFVVFECFLEIVSIFNFMSILYKKQLLFLEQYQFNDVSKLICK